MIGLSFGVVLGQVTLGRLATITLPAALRPHAKALEAAHGAFDDASAHAEAATVTYDDAVAKALSARDAIRASINVLATTLAAASPSTRTHPFKPYGVASPTKLTSGSRAAAGRAGAKVAAAVLATRPKKAARDAANRCTRHASALATAQANVVAARSALVRARDHRAALAAEFAAAFETTKIVAKRVWLKEPGTFASMFGPVEPTMQTLPHKKKRAKAVTKPGATGPSATAPTTTPTATATATPTPTATAHTNSAATQPLSN